MTSQSPSSQTPSSEKSWIRSTFSLLDPLFNLPHKIINSTARSIMNAASEELAQPTHNLTRWVQNIMGWAIIGGIPVLFLWSSNTGTATWERLRGRRAEIIEYEASHNTTSSLRTTRTVTLEDNAHRIYDSKMPQTDVDRLPAIDIPRKADDKFLTLFDGNEFQTVIVLGPKGCGKSTLVIKALKDREAVVKIEGKSTMTVDAILGKIGASGSEEAAKEAITACKLKGRKPIIICEYKMTGRKEDNKSSFKELVDAAKWWQHDKGICRVVFVLSDATLSSTLPKDPNRWISFWVDDFESNEAREYLQQHKIPDDDIREYLNRLGPRPNDLLSLVNAINKKQFIKEMEQKASETIKTLKDDEIYGAQHVELMIEILRHKKLPMRIAATTLYKGKGMNVDEQQESLLKLLKKHHLYQLKDGEILFHSRVIETVAQEMYKAGELKSGH